MSIILSHSEVFLGQNHSVWDSMMLILAAREILYTGPLRFETCWQIYGVLIYKRYIPVKSTDFGGSLPIFYLPTANLPIYHNLPISTDFFADLPNFNFF